MAKLQSLLYLSYGNLPSKMAHTIQVAKMAQALSQKLNDFELVTGGDILSTLKGMDSEFKNWYGLHCDFKLVRLPIRKRINYPFPKNFHSPRYFKLAILYACFKSPSLVYTRSPKIVELLLNVGIPVLWEKHESINEDSSSRKFFTDKNFVGFITISSSLAEDYINYGLSRDKLLVAHSAVDPISFLPYQAKDSARQKLSLPQDAKIVLYSGHLYEYKGIPTILETARLMPEYKFVLVGGWAEDINKVKEACANTNLDNVQIIGHVPQSELATYLYAADVLLLPTSKHWKLGETTSPLKLFEYMFAKRPIVASALPNITTVLRDRENSLLAEPDEPLSFKKAITDLFENPSLANAITERAFQEVQSFTWDSRAEQVLQFAEQRLQRVDNSPNNYLANLSRFINQKVI